jgi:periplasmic divalent cation tolerance protein
MALVYCPCPSLAEARRLGGLLLDSKAAGCINILPGMVSLYDWQGAREEAKETVLIAKTSVERVPEVEALLAAEHPYDVPAILAIPLAHVSAPYAKWLLEGMHREGDS